MQPYISPMVLLNNQNYYDSQNNFRIIFDQQFEKHQGSVVQLKEIITVFKNCDWYANLSKRKRENVFGKGGLSKWIHCQIQKDTELNDHFKTKYKQKRNCIVGWRSKEEGMLYACVCFFSFCLL